MKKNINLSVIGCSVFASGVTSAEQTLSLHHMDYREDDKRINVGDTSLGLKLDLGVDYSLDLSLGYDSVSGASPAWQVDPGASSPGLDAAQELTSQTLLGYAYDVSRYNIRRVDLVDTRKSFTGALTIRDRYRNEWTYGVSHSKENDYKSNSISASYLLYLDKFKNRSLNIGLAYLDDETLVFGSGYQTRTEESLNSFNFETGFTQVLSPKSTFDIKLFINRDSGYLSNHYLTVLRQIDLDNSESIENNEYFLAADSRPDSRNAAGAKMSLAYQPWHWLTGQSSYRYYSDNWAIDSHTLTNSLNFEVINGLFIKPEFIYYEQNGADFYLNPNDVGTDEPVVSFAATGYGSNDVRLGDYHATTFSLTMSYQLTQHWQIDISANRYKQSNEFAATWAVLGINYHF
ncbi:DUF3570 domain-containing protein [Pseudoalteromonas denitrificans]|uniref:Beta-barrel porin 2 n=1 Tax=Pseudoalteromonas denitrificans DSM 6059 TaxID=1123010 RepID=A0A1I1LN99_9GAMM|nr:DUF3570 domain-containing protein [Pseudoalteromonas denitrificans]SFC74697.1 Protein of unknown function [Pseudoalteromonas denitrificans DSM 6059]